VELSGPVPLGEGLIGRAAQTGEIYLASSPAGARGPAAEARLTACIPFKLGGRVVGALALFQLLPQKAGFEEIDREMFNLLATHAAMALHCSASSSQPAARPSA
jgi:GAF domain-containing protein